MAIGVGKTHIITAQANQACPKCNNENSLFFVVKSRYLRIVFIPIFTLGKFVQAECTNCNEIIGISQMPNKLREAALIEKNHHQSPVWHFLGLIFAIGILPGIISSLSYSRYNYDDYNFDFDEYNDEIYVEEYTTTHANNFIAYPEVGDIYEYTISRGNYSTMKVVEVSYDSVFVKKNVIITNSMTYVDDIDIDENYPDSSIGISMEALEALYDGHTIYHIERPVSEEPEPSY